jgi:2-polyprenyl-3-methyl-5-hydroxy-6-metoxy-1,4-benzoquinol methylase
MNFRRFLAARGVHYFVTRFGSRKLKVMAFDEKYRRGDWSFSPGAERELAEVARRYLQNGDLLMMGCGGASLLQGLQSHEFKSALGIDISEEATRLASRLSSDRISFQRADMLTFQCPCPYDVILFSESLNYVPVPDQVPLLNRLTANLKPNGVIIVTFAQAHRYKTILDRIRQHFVVVEDHTFPNSTRHLIVFRA